jgi:acetylornithine/succinyldiaminopimelate/putrescine aminotransferase
MKYQVLLALVASVSAIKINSENDFERHHNDQAQAVSSQLDDIKSEGDAAIQKIREMGNQKVH